MSHGGSGPHAREHLGDSLAAMEREREAWVRELHDGTLQRLTAVRMTLAAARGAPLERMRVGLENAIEALAGEIADLRLRLMRLRPLALGELGLLEALEGLAVSHGAEGLDVRVHRPTGADGWGRLGPALESALFRVAQEAIANAAEHGGARSVEVRVARRAHAVSLSVTDDGVGFDPHADTDGLGLRGLEERIALLGGRLDVSSASATGTTVRARVPLGG